MTLGELLFRILGWIACGVGVLFMLLVAGVLLFIWIQGDGNPRE